MKILILSLTLFSISSLGKEVQMIQADKTFLGSIPAEKIEELWENPLIEKEYKVKEMSLKVGDVIVFKNRDEVNHNVSGSIDEKKVFDVTLQEPGKKNDRKITLKKKGKYIVQCAIHPKMKIEVEVED